MLNQSQAKLKANLKVVLAELNNLEENQFNGYVFAELSQKLRQALANAKSLQERNERIEAENFRLNGFK